MDPNIEPPDPHDIAKAVNAMMIGITAWFLLMRALWESVIILVKWIGGLPL